MMKIFFTAFFLGLSVVLSAQEVPIKPSQETITIEGISYYLHTVEPKQTMYSICRLYGVTIDEVLQANNKPDAALNIGEVLRIPAVKKFETQPKATAPVAVSKPQPAGTTIISEEKTVAKPMPVAQKKVSQPQKRTYKELTLSDEICNYTVQEGETLYGIAVRYELKVRQVLKYNKQFEKQPMHAGDVIKIPVTKQNLGKLREYHKAQFDAQNPMEESTPEEYYKSAEVLSMKDLRSAMDSIRQTPIVQDANASAIQKLENTYQSTVIDSSLSNELNVALVMPFKINESYSALSSNKIKRNEIQFVCFYEGVLLAIDSLQRTGYKINLYVYDTERRKDKLMAISKKLNEIHPHLIIGPVYASEYKIIAENLADKNIPMIYPLSARGENLEAYPAFVQMNPSVESIVNEMTTWVSQRPDSVNVVLLCLDETTKSNDKLLRDTLAKSLARLTNVAQYTWGQPVRHAIRKNADGEEENDDPFQFILQPDKENIIFVPTTQEGEAIKVLSGLAAYASMYKISVMGFEEWQRFENVEHELYFTLNTYLFTYNYVNYEDEKVRYFASKYRRFFESEPEQIVFKAYEMSMYLMQKTLAHKTDLLDAICQEKYDGETSRFDFLRDTLGKVENRGMYIINYSRYNKVHVSNWERPIVVPEVPAEDENAEIPLEGTATEEIW